jgi:nucleoside-diphosphate-sugar epimerase
VNRILVTGARGFIGRQCLPKLRTLGEVHALSSSEVDLLEGAPLELLKKLKPTHLLHLAWIAEPGVFWESPLNQRWQQASVALFEAFYAAGGQRIVAAGSCAEYAPATTPYAEDATPIAPDTAYGRAKAATGDALQATAGTRGWAWMRLFFPYGPGEHPARFIPAAINAELRGEKLDCTSGTQVRDFIHVRDVAEACAFLLAEPANGAFNVGSGEGHTLREVGALLAAETGAEGLLRWNARAAPPNDRPCVVADLAKMCRLGWKPRLSLAEGLRLTLTARKRELGLQSA